MHKFNTTNQKFGRPQNVNLVSKFNNNTLSNPLINKQKSIKIDIVNPIEDNINEEIPITTEIITNSEIINSEITNSEITNNEITFHIEEIYSSNVIQEEILEKNEINIRPPLIKQSSSGLKFKLAVDEIMLNIKKKKINGWSSL
jgi:hypothetical protein